MFKTANQNNNNDYNTRLVMCDILTSLLNRLNKSSNKIDTS